MNQEPLVSAGDFLVGDVHNDDDPGWLNALRQSASDQFIGLPGRSTEQWKYTPVPGQAFRAAKDLADPVDPGVPGPLADAPARVVLVNGRPVEIAADSVPGMTVLSLDKAVASADHKLSAVLESLPIEGLRHGFSQLNTAALGRGLYVHIGSGIDAGELLLQWVCGAEQMNHSRLCVVLEPGARLHLVEQFENASGEAAQLNLVAQVKLGEDAELVHSRLQEYPRDSLLIGRTEISQASSSRYYFTGMDLGHGLARHDVRSEFSGADARCSLNAAVLGSGAAHVDYHLEADHRACDCQSRQLFRAVGGGRSRIVFNGRVHVAPGADGSDSQQSSAGLLLSRQAEIDAKPELEILADEVVAAHGATVGQLDNTAMFYLQSRGISRNEARKMLTRAFCRSVIDEIPHEALQKALDDRLTSAMGQLEGDNE